MHTPTQARLRPASLGLTASLAIVVAGSAVAVIALDKLSWVGLTGSAVVVMTIVGCSARLSSRGTFLAGLVSAGALTGGVGLFAAQHTWQLVPWLVLAAAAFGSVALTWRPRRDRRAQAASTFRRRAVKGVTVLSAGLMGLLGTASLLFDPVPDLPAPTGPYAVGSQTYTWTDQARVEQATASADQRQVVVQAWYPTSAPDGPSEPYLGDADGGAMPAAGYPSWFFNRFDEIYTHAFHATPVRDNSTGWPVLLFSPGAGIGRQAYTALSVDLASRGYVVVAMSHPYDSAGTRLADGTIAPVDPARMATPEQNAHLVDIRVADATFILDQIGHLSTAEPGSVLVGHLDLSRMAMIGHSLGGATATEMLANDPRIGAAVNIDGRLFGTAPHLARPFLWIQNSETANATIRNPNPSGVYSDMTDLERDTLTTMTGPGGLLILEHSRHLDFSDLPAYLGPLGRRVLGKFMTTGGRPLDRRSTLLAGVIDDFMGNGMSRPGITTVDGLADHDPDLTAYSGTAQLANAGPDDHE